MRPKWVWRFREFWSLRFPFQPNWDWSSVLCSLARLQYVGRIWRENAPQNISRAGVFNKVPFADRDEMRQGPPLQTGTNLNPQYLVNITFGFVSVLGLLLFPCAANLFAGKSTCTLGALSPCTDLLFSGQCSLLNRDMRVLVINVG